MNWPNKIQIHFSHEDKNISDLLVFIIIKSNKKNDFGFEPMLTNNLGRITISLNDILENIENLKNEYPMDYNGEIKDCYGIEIIIEDANILKNKIDNLKFFYPKNAENLYSLFKKSVNKNYLNHRVIFNTPINNDLLEVEI